MANLTKNQLYSTLLLLCTAVISSNSLADPYPLEEKLQQCEAAFEQMHGGNLTQKDAWQVRRDHKKLVREILEYLNKRNHTIWKSNDPAISTKEIIENFVVMGSLLEMVATENLRLTDEWGYPVSQ